MNSKLHEINHPVVRHKLSLLRDKNTNSPHFRELMKEMGRILAYESTKDLSLKAFDLETPFAISQGQAVENPPVVISIMRAGNGMLDGVLSMLPFASAGHIGIYRDKFIKNTVEYYFKIPDEAEGREVLLIDPLIGTGDTILACIDRLKQYNVGKIKVLCCLVAPEGLERLQHFHPEIDIFTFSKEEGLNENGYIIPGIGDAGDRLFQTR
jgi:uracil phosphoribosyltransferase